MHQHNFEYISYLFSNKDVVNNYLPQSYDDNTIIFMMALNLLKHIRFDSCILFFDKES